MAEIVSSLDGVYFVLRDLHARLVNLTDLLL